MHLLFFLYIQKYFVGNKNSTLLDYAFVFLYKWLQSFNEFEIETEFEWDQNVNLCLTKKIQVG